MSTVKPSPDFLAALSPSFTPCQLREPSAFLMSSRLTVIFFAPETTPFSFSFASIVTVLAMDYAPLWAARLAAANMSAVVSFALSSGSRPDWRAKCLRRASKASHRSPLCLLRFGGLAVR